MMTLDEMMTLLSQKISISNDGCCFELFIQQKYLNVSCFQQILSKTFSRLIITNVY